MQTRISTLILLLLGVGVLNAQVTYKVHNAEISISGTSSFHDWTSTTSTLSATGDFVLEGETLKGISTLEVSIPVSSIISGRGQTMDNKTYKALQSEEHPNILFNLQKVNSIENNGDSILLKTTGLLTVAGKTKTIELTVNGQREANGVFHFTGNHPMKMTDFDIEPPTALFGTLKTGDAITIGFDLNLITESTEN